MTEPSDDDEHDDNIYIYDGDDIVSLFATHVRVVPSARDMSYPSFMSCYRLLEVELPEGLTSIRRWTFGHCKSLRSINIPSTVTEIGGNAFYNCVGLKEIILPQSLLKLGEGAFGSCISLEAIHIPPLIQTIEAKTFSECRRLTEVMLPMNLQEIKERAFDRCIALATIDFPSNLRRIGEAAFHDTGLTEFTLPDSVEVCGSFKNCQCTNLRLPPHFATLNFGIFHAPDVSTVAIPGSDTANSEVRERGRNRIVSIELPESITQITLPSTVSSALPDVRNIAYPRGCIIQVERFEDEKVRTELFEEAYRLTRRFDGLPLHKICYYHSYHDTSDVLSNMMKVIYPKSTRTRCGKLNDTGKSRDVLGMTPLHILSCSSKHSLEMYQLLVEKYPETLVTKDLSGDIPLLYVFWCNDSKEIIAFLAESYKTKYPDYALRWEDMVLSLVMYAPLPRIQILLNTRVRYFPDEKCNLIIAAIALARIIDLERSRVRNQVDLMSKESVRFLLNASIEERANALNVRRWRHILDYQISMICTLPERLEDHTLFLFRTLDIFESIKEHTSLLELALWKAALSTDRMYKKARIDNDTSLSHRDHCRLHCGAEIVIRNVLPFVYGKPFFCNNS